MFEAIKHTLIEREGDKIYWVNDARYLYKGLEIYGFPTYFAHGGIQPRDPRSITEDWEKAEDHGNISTPFRNRECFAVIRKDTIEGELIESHGSDFSGDYFIPWSALVKLFVSKNMLDDIKKAYKTVAIPTITWDNFIAKITIIKPDQLSFRRAFRRFLEQQWNA